MIKKTLLTIFFTFITAEIACRVFVERSLRKAVQSVQKHQALNDNMVPVPDFKNYRDWAPDRGPSQMPHPFLGHVPQRAGAKTRESTHHIVNFEDNAAFLDRANRRDNDFYIGIFGGSVAENLFYLESSEHFLEKNLRKHFPALKEKRFFFVSFSIGYGAQPRQLMAAALHGRRLDLALNIEGANEFGRAVSKKFPVYFPSAEISEAFFTTDQTDLRNNLQRFQDVIDKHESEDQLNSASTISSFHRSLLLFDVLRQYTRISKYVRSIELYPYGIKSIKHSLRNLWVQSTIDQSFILKGQNVPFFAFAQPLYGADEAKILSTEEILMGAPYKAYSPNYNERQANVADGARLLERVDGLKFKSLLGIFENVKETVYIDDFCHLNTNGYVILVDAMISYMSAHMTCDRSRCMLKDKPTGNKNDYG